MPPKASQLPVSEVARRLGVSPQRVRAMIAAGVIDAEKAAGSWWIPAGSLARVVAADRDGGRPLSPTSAWALLLIASGDPVPWAPPKVRWRTSMGLRAHGLTPMFGKLRRRAQRRAFEAHPGELHRLRERRGLMLSGLSAAAEHHLGLPGGDEVEAYVAAGELERVTAEHGLLALADGEATVVLRAVPDELWSAVARSVAPLVAVLVDLAEHADPRARRVALERARQLDRERAARG